MNGGMKKVWKSRLVIAFLVAAAVLLGLFNETKPRILVVHSNSRDSDWVAQMDRGMRAALKDNRRPVNVEWLYLDAVAPAARDRNDQVRSEVRRAVGQLDPDVVIAVDDEANSLISKEYLGRESPRILYISLDRPPADYGYVGAPNAAGIAEQLPFTAIRDAATALFPGRRPTATVIGVDNITGRAEMAQMRQTDWGPVTITDTALVSTAAGWRDFVTASRSDVLIVLSVQDLPGENGAEVTVPEIVRWTQENSRPVPIGTQVDFVKDGGALSFSPPPDDYGRRAIALALDWLDERRTPGPPAPVESPHFTVSMRRDALAARGLTLPSVYTEAARAGDTLYG